MPGPRRPLAAALCAVLVAILLGASTGPAQSAEGPRITSTASTPSGQKAAAVQPATVPDLHAHLDLLVTLSPLVALGPGAAVDDRAADAQDAAAHRTVTPHGRGPPRG